MMNLHLLLKVYLSKTKIVFAFLGHTGPFLQGDDVRGKPG